MNSSTELRAAYSKWLKGALNEGYDPDGIPWSHARLANESGVARATISSILNCEADAQEDKIQRLVKAVGIPVPEIRVTLVSPRPKIDQRAKRPSSRHRFGDRGIGTEAAFTVLDMLIDTFEDMDIEIEYEKAREWLRWLYDEAVEEINHRGEGVTLGRDSEASP